MSQDLQDLITKWTEMADDADERCADDEEEAFRTCIACLRQVVDRQSSDTVVAIVEPEPVAESREMTSKECTAALLDHLLVSARYWGRDDLEGDDGQQMDTTPRLFGLVFSMLCAVDGVASGLPGWRLAPSPHPSDREDAKANGENWWPLNDGPPMPGEHDGSTMLHDLWGKGWR